MLSMKNKRRLLGLMSWWPPLLGAGIRVRRIAPDFRAVEVELVQHWWNTNYVGVHFGGSLFAMTDPFFMLMLIENLGPEYIVWDKAAAIRFRRPGHGTVRAEFRITEEQLDEIRRAADSAPKIDRHFNVEVRDETGEVVAIVQRTLHVSRKDAKQ
jgi:acyl-coenzyme A thioesterase PaaI-like protein